MSVAFDANATSATSVNPGTTLDNGNLTIGSAANMVLVAQIVFRGAITSQTMVWDPAGANQSMSLIQTKSSAGSLVSQLWGLVAPVSGNKICRAAWTTSQISFLNCTSFSGADQTGGTTTFPNGVGATAASGSPSITVTSKTGDMAVETAAGVNVLSVPTQTQLWQVGAQGGQRAAGAATVSFGWTMTTGDWSEVGCDIAQFLPAVPSLSEMLSGGIVGTNWSRS
jgi:hypothetical protein